MKPRGRSGETRPRFGEWVYFGAGVAPEYCALKRQQHAKLAELTRISQTLPGGYR